MGKRLIFLFAAVVLLVAAAVQFRYAFIPAQGKPLLYRVDRWTGRAWVACPSGNPGEVLHWSAVSEVPW
jgi:hypothetical protein